MRRVYKVLRGLLQFLFILFYDAMGASLRVPAEGTTNCHTLASCAIFDSITVTSYRLPLFAHKLCDVHCAGCTVRMTYKSVRARLSNRIRPHVSRVSGLREQKSICSPSRSGIPKISPRFRFPPVIRTHP